jgi:hypothetical protein
MIPHILELLQHNRLIVAMNTSASFAAALEVVHYFGFFVLIGASAIVDLRIMGLAGRKQSAAHLSALAFPWIWSGLGLALVSGFIMFSGTADEYVHNHIFHRKLLVVTLATASMAAIQRIAAKSDREPAMPAAAKLLALISLLLWVSSILMGVDVPAITGVG